MQCVRLSVRSAVSASRHWTSLSDIMGFSHCPPSSSVSMTNTVESAMCELDAEPLRRYRAGGYHPLHLGDRFKSNRYEVLHKLGWGGYATVWLAKDHKCVLLIFPGGYTLTVSQTWATCSHEIPSVGAMRRRSRSLHISSSCGGSCCPSRQGQRSTNFRFVHF